MSRRRTLADEALDGVTARPTRLALTTFGAALGIGSILATTGLAQTASSQVAHRFDAVAATQLSVQPRTASDPTGSGQQALVQLPWDGEQRIDRLAGTLASGTISQVLPQASVRTVAVTDPTAPASVGLPLIATSPGLFDAVLATMETGRTFDAGHDARADPVVVLGARAAARLGINRVDDAPTVFISDRPFVVIGIVFATVRHTELLDSLIIPDGTAAKYFGLESPLSMQIRTELGAAASVGRQAAIALSPGQPGLVEVSLPTTNDTLRNRVQGDVNVLFLILGSIALLAGAVGIANVTLLSVMERTSEIGLRRALGAKRPDIAIQFLLESGITGLLGGLVGACGGVVVTLAVSVNRHWTPVLDLRFAIAAPVLGGLIGVLAGAYPAWRACRIEPIAALRSA
jgi:putative ABC transport system permease protein